MLREVLGDNVEANATPEHGPVRELREGFGSETEGTSFVGITVHAYDHHTLALLVDTAVYRSGTLVLHVHAASRWAAVAALHTSAGHSNDSSVARH